MKRREFLGITLAGMGSLLPACGGGGGGGPMMGGPPGPDAALAQGQPLRSLVPLANTAADPGRFAATLAAGPASLGLVEGRSTALWLYNGLFPGPLVDVREGDRVRVALENRLALDTTAHWHGLPSPRTRTATRWTPCGPAPRASTSSTFPPVRRAPTGTTRTRTAPRPSRYRWGSPPRSSCARPGTRSRTSPRSRCWSPASGSMRTARSRPTARWISPRDGRASSCS